MITRGLLALGVAVAALAASGPVVASPPEPTDDDVEEVAELAFEKWLNSQGATHFIGTLACGVDSLSSSSAYCYAHTETGIVAATSPIPATGGTWQFTLILGSVAGTGTPVPTSWPAPTDVGASPTTVTPATTAPPAGPEPPKPTGPETPTPTVTAAVAPGDTFGEGLHIVNEDIAPGRYQSGPTEFCYWERSSSESGDTESIIANSIVMEGPAVVDILGSDVAFISNGCAEWSPYTPPVQPLTTFGPGVYVVGSDIVPGTYSGEGDENCYWRRLGGFTGNFDQLISIENMNAPGSVVIEATDVGFQSNECGTWTLVAPSG